LRCAIELEFSREFSFGQPRFDIFSMRDGDFDHITTLGLAPEATGPEVGNENELTQRSASRGGVNVALDEDFFPIDVISQSRRRVRQVLGLLELLEWNARVAFGD